MEAKATKILNLLKIFNDHFYEKYKIRWKIEKPQKWSNDTFRKATVRVTFRIQEKNRKLFQIQFQFEEEFDKFLEENNWFRGATNCHYNTGGRLTIRVTMKFKKGSEGKRMLQTQLRI